MVKLLNKLRSTALVIGLLTGCGDPLDIEPEGILTEDQVFNSANTTEMALGAVYHTFMKNAVGIAYMYGDITTQNVQVLDGGGVYGSFINAEYASNDVDAANFWTGLYETINLANNVIHKVEEIGLYDADIEQQHIAEAKFIRAFCYFKLLKYFGEGALTNNLEGMGVPLQLEEYDGTGVENFKPRSTNGQVYDQIIQDLTEAIDKLPETYANQLSTASRATVGSAYALLSRVYLYTRQYALAASSANYVITGNVYDLVADLRTLFPTNPNLDELPMTVEDIFTLPISANRSSVFASSTNVGKNNIFYAGFTSTRWVNDNLIQAFEPGDNRKLQLIVQDWKQDAAGQYIAVAGFDASENKLAPKLSTYKFGPNIEENVPLIRLAEVLLISAEALAHTEGINQESVKLLNRVRSRAIPDAAVLTLSDFASADELINKILLERRLELMFEGHERYDLIRTGRKNQLANPDLSNEQLVMPIPQLEVDLSKGIIKQNTAYN